MSFYKNNRYKRSLFISTILIIIFFFNLNTSKGLLMNTTHPQAKLTLKRVAFYFIRHGETDWNVQKKIMGQLDIPLNNRGKE